MAMIGCDCETCSRQEEEDLAAEAFNSARGTWRATPYPAEVGKEMALIHLAKDHAKGGPYLAVVSRSDVSDLIALLERVRERLPE